MGSNQFTLSNMRIDVGVGNGKYKQKCLCICTAAESIMYTRWIVDNRNNTSYVRINAINKSF